MGVYIPNIEKPKKGEVIAFDGEYAVYTDDDMQVHRYPLIEIDLVRKPIKDYEGYYEVDQFGRVFSVERTVTVNDNGRVYEKPVKARQLKQWTHNNGYKMVSLTKDGKTEVVKGE